MKRKTSCFLLLLLLVAGTACSQPTVKPQFISIKNEYEFTLPQFDVSLPLPANAEFKVPRFSGKNIKLEVDDVTCYYFDESYLKDPKFQFVFGLPGQREKGVLYLNITKLNKTALKEKIDTSVISGERVWISSIKTQLGKTLSYRTTFKNGKTTETHVVTKDDYSFAFTISNDMDEKVQKQYLKLIRGFTEKKQPYLRVRYETQVKNGDFEPRKEEKKKEPIKSVEHKSAVQMSTVFEWPDLGYSVQIPEGWKYRVEGKLVSEAPDYMKVTYDRSFLSSDFMAMSWFNNDELYFALRSYRKVNVSQIIEGQANAAKHTQAVDLVVNGVVFKGCFYGSKSYGTLDFGFEAKNAQHWVSINGVTQENIALVEKLLSGIKINNEELKSKDTDISVPDLASQLQLEELGTITLDEPLSLAEDWPEKNMFDCELVDLGLNIRLPGKQSDYLCMIDKNREGIKDGKIMGLPENDTDKRLMIFSTTGGPISYSISKKEQSVSNEKYVLGFKRGWSVYKDVEAIHGSLAHVNGLEWCVCISRSGSRYMCMLSTQVDSNHEVFISIQVTSEEEALRSVAYLKTVSNNSIK